MDQGILVASDKNGEWLLDWWWNNYSRENSYPVAFIDFGMSNEKLKWCSERGQTIEFPFTLKTTENKEFLEKAKAQYGNEIHAARNCWFKKPLALTLTPFKQTIWLDTDCEVLGSLSKLFNYKGLALAKTGIGSDEYNSGVVIYEKNSPIIQKWADNAVSNNANYIGDQDLFSHMVFNEQLKVTDLPFEYNWNISNGINENALIIHWSSTWGKTYIKKHGGIYKTLQNLTTIGKAWSMRQGTYCFQEESISLLESNGKFTLTFHFEKSWIKKNAAYNLTPLSNTIALIKLEQNALTFLQFDLNNSALLFDKTFLKMNE